MQKTLSSGCRSGGYLGKDDVEVGRIRKDYSIENALNLWVCGDQIRKGAALNALQVAEYMVEHDMF